MTQCIAYRDDDRICKNGFIQVLACRQEVKCLTCGNPSARIPHCLKDELLNHWITEEGKPRFYREASQVTSTKSGGAA